MKEQDKKIVIYFVLVVVITIVVIIYMNYSIGNPIIPESSIVNDTFVKVVDIKKEKIFNTIAKISEYPKILPKNYVSVKIINQTNNTIYAEEEVVEMSIKTKMLVKHTILPYDKHILEILNGEANGTKIIGVFEGNGSTTRIITNVNLHLHGILSPFGLLPKSNLEHAMDTVITNFVNYSKNQTNNSN